MIIRSQNKKRITDSLNLAITIHEYESTDEVYEIRTCMGVVIGEYSTMEKAVKVLDMIADTYGAYEEGKAQKYLVSKEAVFNMPQDSEVIACNNL